MKKAMIIIAAAMAGLIALGSGGVYAVGQVAKTSAIDKEIAKNFAYLDAGVSPEDAVGTDTEFKFKNGQFVYEIEFIADGVEYEYTVDSSTGRIIESEREVINAAAAAPDTAAEAIGEAKAKEAALKKAGLAEKDVERLKVELETENGRKIYDVEFISGGFEYKYEIDAFSGEIREENREALRQGEYPQHGTDTVPAEESASEGITVAEAKAIALRSAGVPAAKAVFSKAKLEKEDGRLVYDIEFYVEGDAEYDYEIDFKTGEIVDSDREPLANTTAKPAEVEAEKPSEQVSGGKNTQKPTAPKAEKDDDDDDDDRDDDDDDDDRDDDD